MTLDTNRTVRELVVEMPDATRIFEKLKIDYCCGGHKPLEVACAAAGVDAEEVVRLLEETNQAGSQSATSTDFQTLSLTELASYIVCKHHVFTRQEMERLDALLGKVCSVHGANHPELLNIKPVFQNLKAELEQHMLKEERALFPYIAQMESAFDKQQPLPAPPFGTVRNPVRVMTGEHDAAGECLREMRDLSSNYAVPPDVCISYRTLYTALEALEADLHQHIHLENNLLFPRALGMENMMTQAATV
jgi:regulator of cell morphogenesis and NO signaling